MEKSLEEEAEKIATNIIIELHTDRDICYAHTTKRRRKLIAILISTAKKKGSFNTKTTHTL